MKKLKMKTKESPFLIIKKQKLPLFNIFQNYTA